MGAPTDGHYRARGLSGVVLAFLLVAGTAGCSAVVAGVPVVPLDEETSGFKMLAPGVSSRRCGMTLGPIGTARPAAMLESALAELKDRNGEANQLRNVRFTWRGVDLLIARAGCLRVQGDLGRTAPVVLLPMLGESGHHGHH